MLGNHIIRQVLTQVLALISAFIVSVITARILGPEGRGDFALIVNTASFLTFLFGFSFGSSVIHVISSGKMPVQRTVNTFFLVIFALIMLCALALLLYPRFSHSLFIPDKGERWFYKLFLVLLFSVQMFMTLFNAALSGLRVFKQQQLLSIALSGLSIAAYLFCFYYRDSFRGDLRSFLIFYLFVASLPGLTAAVLYQRQASQSKTSGLLSMQDLKYVLGFSFLAYLCSVFHFLSCKMDFWLVEYFRGSESLGYYSLSSNLAQMLWLLPQAIAVILIAYAGQGDRLKNIAQTNTLIRTSLYLLVLAGVFLFFVIDYFIPFAFGSAFLPSCRLFKLLLIGVIPFSVTTILSAYFAGSGKMLVNLYASITGFITCLVLDLVLIPRYGTVGASVAASCGYIAATVVSVAIYLKESNSRVQNLLMLKKEDVSMIMEKLHGIKSSAGA